MRKEGKLNSSPKDFYKVAPEILALLRPTETEEQVSKYFDHIKLCIELDVCSDCGQGVIFTSSNREEHVKEYSISGLCVACQIKAFGE